MARMGGKYVVDGDKIRRVEFTEERPIGGKARRPAHGPRPAAPEKAGKAALPKASAVKET